MILSSTLQIIELNTKSRNDFVVNEIVHEAHRRNSLLKCGKEQIFSTTSRFDDSFSLSILIFSVALRNFKDLLRTIREIGSRSRRRGHMCSLVNPLITSRKIEKKKLRQDLRWPFSDGL